MVVLRSLKFAPSFPIREVYQICFLAPIPQTPERENCDQVPDVEFNNKVHGVWELYIPNRTGSPMCYGDGDDGLNYYIYFDAENLLFGSFSRRFKGFDEMLACIQGPFNSGGEKKILSSNEMMLCQTKSLRERYGDKFYYLKLDLTLVSQIILRPTMHMN